MLKIRVTYVSEKPQELEQLRRTLERDYKILNQSKIYKGRGSSCYDNVYFDVEKKE